MLDTGNPTVDRLIDQLEQQLESSPDHYLLCRACAHAITRDDHRIAVNGADTHHVINPHQIQFEIACFNEAPGCSIYGERTADFTWFPGFDWQLALCGECQDHLGWFYQSPAKYFFGLIRDKLQAEQPPTD